MGRRTLIAKLAYRRLPSEEIIAFTRRIRIWLVILAAIRGAPGNAPGSVAEGAGETGRDLGSMPMTRLALPG